MTKLSFQLFLLLSIFISALSAQCLAGEVEVNLTVYTDDYGYEGYWEIVPTGNTCGSGTLLLGGM